MSGEFEGFGVDKIDVGGGYSENDTVRLCDVFGNEISCLFLDISRLVADGNLRHVSVFFRCFHELIHLTFVRPGKSTSVRLRTCGE